MTRCVKCGQEKESYSQGLLGKMLAWECQECVYGTKKIKFQSPEDLDRGMRIIQMERYGEFIVDEYTRDALDRHNVKYWVVSY